MVLQLKLLPLLLPLPPPLLLLLLWYCFHCRSLQQQHWALLLPSFLRTARMAVAMSVCCC